MGTINPDWYAANATRAYPLDDAATARDDAGNELPPQILVDCRVRFPLTLGKFAYIGGITVGPSIVTATLLASPDTLRPPGDVQAVGASFQPLGAVSLPRPVQSNRHYPIQPMAAGVGGWLVFGRGINDEPYSGRFSTPAQSLLLPRIASAYELLPIPSLGKFGLEQALTGVVQLLGGTDIAVVQKTVTIEGVEVAAIALGLIDSLNRNVFSFYMGPCAGRPESNTCEKAALQSINTVVPDCDGNLTIDFQHVTVIDFAGGGGQALDFALGLADTCLGQDYLPDDSGNLPSDYEDQCPPVVPVTPPGGGEAPPIIWSDACTPLPYYESFDELSTDLPPAWRLVTGDYAIEIDDSPGEPVGLSVPASGPLPGHTLGFPGIPPLHRASGTPDVGLVPVNKCLAVTNVSKRNVVVWECGQPENTEMTCTVHLKVLPGAQANGGIVQNYWLQQPDNKFADGSSGNCVGYESYGFWLVNPVTNSLEEWAYCLGGPNATAQKVTWWTAGAGVDQIVVGDWYQLTVRIGKYQTYYPMENPWKIRWTLTGITKPSFKQMSSGTNFGDLEYTGPNFKYIFGAWGVGSINAHCRFSFLQVEETPLETTTS